MPSPKRKKSSPKVPSKLSAKRHKPQKKTPKRKGSKTTLKLNKLKKPTEPTKAERLTRLARNILNEQLKNLLPSDDLAHVTMKLPQVLEGNLNGPLRPYRALLGYSNLKETSEHCQWAALCLYPGITERGAIDAVKLLMKKLPTPTNPRGGQTAYSPARIAWIHQAFDRCTNGGGRRYATGDQWIMHYLQRSYDRRLSEWERSPHAQTERPLVPRPELEVLQPGKRGKDAIMYRAIIGAFDLGLTSVKEQHKLWKDAQAKKLKRGDKA